MFLHTSSLREAEKNIYYRNELEVRDLNDLKNAVRYDHMANRMKDGKRNKDNFIGTNCIMLDLDNTHSEDEADWKTLDDICDMFPDVKFYAIQSRHHMKVKTKVSKDGVITHYEPRPKYHLYFPTSGDITDGDHFESIMFSAVGLFTYFDAGAIDKARFFYGVESPEGEYIEGSSTIDQYLSTIPREDIVKNLIIHLEEIISGDQDRAKSFKKVFEYFGLSYGESNDDETHKQLRAKYYASKKADSITWLEKWAENNGVILGRRYDFSSEDHPGTTAICVTCPWEHEHSMNGSENESIILIGEDGKLSYKCFHSHGLLYGWKEYRGEVERRNGKNKPKSLMPKHFTDLEQANAFVQHYGDVLRFNKGTGFLVYDGLKWNKSEENARLMVHDFVKNQEREVSVEIRDAQERYNIFVETHGGKKPEADTEEYYEYVKLKTAESELRKDQSKVFSYQASGKITAILSEAAPKVFIDIDMLDADGYILNTPDGVVDLRTGELRPGQPDDYCTKITACGPSDQGVYEWETFLEQVTGGDNELKNYLQISFGMAAIGDVKQEKLLIPYGSGGNGKSTLCNAVSYVLGDYSGTLSADALTMNTRKNLGPEYAELRGKRLVIASELAEGMRLSTSVVKQLCSTDRITADPKYKDVFFFKPTHTLVLFTNHLPKVGTNDSGTWSRLVVIPFNGVFRNTSGEIMNYAAALAEKCGGAILQWTIEGAMKFIASGYRLPEAKAVNEAIEAYRDANDWLTAFLEERCTVESGLKVKASLLYTTYREYCDEIGDFKRSTAEFKTALENTPTITWHRDFTGAYYYGVGIKYANEFKPVLVSNTPFSEAVK